MLSAPFFMFQLMIFLYFISDTRNCLLFKGISFTHNKAKGLCSYPMVLSHREADSHDVPEISSLMSEAPLSHLVGL